MKLSFVKALILALLLAIPKQTRSNDHPSPFGPAEWLIISGLISGLVISGLAAWYFSPTNDQIVDGADNDYKKSMNSYNKILENLETTLGQKESWNTDEAQLEQLAKQDVDAQDFVHRFLNASKSLKEKREAVKEIITKLNSKNKTDEELSMYYRATELEKNIEVLINRFDQYGEILKNNVDFFEFYKEEQKLVREYNNEINSAFRSPDEFISFVKHKKAGTFSKSDTYFPMIEYVQHLKSDQQQLNKYQQRLSARYPQAAVKAQWLSNALENTRQTVINDFHYKEEVLDRKAKLAEEKERKAEKKLQEAKRKEKEVKQKQTQQFVSDVITSFDQVAQQAHIENEKEKLARQQEKLKHEKWDLEKERERIKDQTLENKQKNTEVLDALRVELAAKAASFAAEKISELKSEFMWPVNPQLVDTDAILQEIELEELNETQYYLSNCNALSARYADNTLKARAQQKAQQKFEAQVNQILQQ